MKLGQLFRQQSGKILFFLSSVKLFINSNNPDRIKIGAINNSA